jgi:hypothetical protein
MVIVKKLVISLWKCGDKKLQLYRPGQIIILKNFWDFFLEVWIPLKFGVNSNHRNLWNLYFKLCFDLEVWPMEKVVHLRLIYQIWIYKKKLEGRKVPFPIFEFRSSNQFWKIKEKVENGSGLLVSCSARPLARASALRDLGRRSAAPVTSSHTVRRRWVGASMPRQPLAPLLPLPFPSPARTPCRTRASLRSPLLAAHRTNPSSESNASECSVCHTTHRACGAVAPSLTPPPCVLCRNPT